ncbi:MAG: amidohydrolase [Treponema sp.]|nr:amidohydrolase [Treponema sp.]
MNYLEIFHHLHENPELSFEEFETTAFIKKILTEEKIEILDLPLKTGLVARIKGSGAGKKIAFRADIDALPLEEKTSLSYKSKNPGKMHACGHDVHTTVALETARIIKKNREKFSGEILFIFQPSEENGRGALEVIKTGVLEGLEAIFSLHSSPLLDVGEFGIKEGAITSAVDLFKITITGKGCHGATPQDGNDPILASAALINALQSIVSRNVSPFEAAVLSITHIEGGSNWNIIPDQVLLEGTFRSCSRETRALIGKRLEEISENIALAHNTKAQVEREKGPPSTDNDALLARYCQKKCEEMGFKALKPQLTTVGEDFAYYQEKYRGIMVWLGVGKSYPLHNPLFQADPKAIEKGAEYFSRLLVDFLKENG